MSKELCRNFIFTKAPLKGFFGFEDKFQIYPCEFPNMPQIHKLCEHFPAVIEFYIDTDENPVPREGSEYAFMTKHFAHSSNVTYHLNRLANILTALTNHGFFTYPKQKCWAVPLSAVESLGGGEDNLKSE